MSEILKQEAKDLEEQLWVVANRLGIDRTHENVEMIHRVFSGVFYRQAKATSEIPLPDDASECISATESVSVDVILLSICFMCLSLIRDKEEVGDSAWQILCSCNRAVGMLESSVGIGSIAESLKGIFSRLGSHGASVRHAPMGNLKKWAVDQYQQGKWPSANAAAFALTEQVIEHGKSINAHLSPANAQRTIAEWFRKSV